MSEEVGMRQVGEFSGPYLNGRKLIRATKNPMDKCTIISIFPLDIDETKPTIEPGKFHIDAGSFEKPSILVIGSSSWWREIDADQPMLEIPTSSIQVADSIIKDYANGLLGCNMADCMPGLFYVMGAITVKELKDKYTEKLIEVNARQNNWYKILVRLADSLWSRTNGNPLTISNEMRIAANALGMKDKPWLKDFVTATLTNCHACGTLKNPLYPVCPSCKSVDMSHPAAKELKFAV